MRSVLMDMYSIVGGIDLLISSSAFQIKALHLILSTRQEVEHERDSKKDANHLVRPCLLLIHAMTMMGRVRSACI